MKIALKGLTFIFFALLFLGLPRRVYAACPARDLSVNFSGTAISLIDGLVDGAYYMKGEFENGLLFKDCRSADVAKCDFAKDFIKQKIAILDNQIKAFKSANPSCQYAYSDDVYAIDLCTWGPNRNRLCALGVQLVPLEPIDFGPGGGVTIPGFSCSSVGGSSGINTAIGCIPVNPSDFIGFTLRLAIGLGGLIAFLFIIYGGFTIATSSGQPDKLKNGQELIVGAISGLLLIIFAVVLLEFVGYDILRIPGFTP